MGFVSVIIVSGLFALGLPLVLLWGAAALDLELHPVRICLAWDPRSPWPG